MRPIKYSMPADFVDQMHTSYDDLMARYNVSENVVRRWISETGIRRQNRAQVKGLGAAPASFVLAAKHMDQNSLMERFGVSDDVIRRWKRENGIPLANERVVSTGTFELAHIDTAILTRAIKHLQRDRAVTRRNAAGHYDPSGSYWLCGTKLLDATGVIALAEKRGFVADAWKQVAA